MNPPLLSAADRSTLLAIAREAVTAAAAGRPTPPLALEELSPPLREVRATFITLTASGALRGCIGGLEAVKPLALDAQEHAVSAALYDPRFLPVTPDEVPALEIEISILTTPELIPHATPQELLAALRPNVDGVLLRSGYYRATFLPQVWENVPDPQRFLEMLSEKMGAPADSWRLPTVEAFRYQVEKIAEGERD